MQAHCASGRWSAEIFFKLNPWPGPRTFPGEKSLDITCAVSRQTSCPTLAVAEPEACSTACISACPPLPSGGDSPQCHGSSELAGGFPSSPRPGHPACSGGSSSVLTGGMRVYCNNCSFTHSSGRQFLDLCLVSLADCSSPSCVCVCVCVKCSAMSNSL